MANKAETRFAPAERAPESCVRRQRGYFSPNTLTCRMLDALPGILFVLNAQRQIIYVNRALLQLVNQNDESACLGLRPGEVFGCSHAGEMPGGCGTSEACSTCGAALAILSGLAGEGDVRECRLTRCRNERFEAFDLQVVATPTEHAGERFVVLAVTDVSHLKRRQAFERIFFHDILNLMGSVRGFAELLGSYELENRQEIYRLVHDAAEQVIGEIEAQRMLLAAECGTLKPKAELVEVESFLGRQVELYRHHPVAEGRTLELAADTAASGLWLNTDRALLGRILGNMIKNALEASPVGARVFLSCRRQQNQVEFEVHNVGEIPPAVQWQIFKRNFSTRGEQRGLGTYSMKLLSQYLGGDISFTSDGDRGTMFRLQIPLAIGEE